MIIAVLLAKGIDIERSHDIAVNIRSLPAHGLGTPQSYATAVENLARYMSQRAGFYIATLFANMWQVSRTFRFLI